VTYSGDTSHSKPHNSLIFPCDAILKIKMCKTVIFLLSYMGSGAGSLTVKESIAVQALRLQMELFVLEEVT
jgi:hypothetical protein